MMSNFINTFDFKLQADNSKSLDLFLYSNIRSGYEYDVDNNNVRTSRTSATYFASELSKYPDVEQINLYINSLGGEIKEGVAIGNQLKHHKAHVTCYVDGWACSIASVIAMSADEIIMYRNSLMMIHQASTYCNGNADDMRAVANELDQMTETAITTYTDRCGDKCSREKITELVKAGTWINAQDCLDMGLCDKVIDEQSKADMSKMLTAAKSCMSAEIGNNIDKLIKLYDEQQALGTTKTVTKATPNMESVFKKFLNLED